MKETTVIFEEVITVRKLLLVVLIGIVLAFDVFGLVQEVVSYFEEQTQEIDTNPPGTITVYVKE